MRKKMIGRACAAVLIAGMMFAEGAEMPGKQILKIQRSRKRRQITRRRRMLQEKRNIH